MNLLRILSNTDWGANRLTLLSLYRSLLRPKIDYGCFLSNAAHKLYIETIENEALRICLEAFRTTPTNSLHTEANELPFSLRSIKIGLNLFIRILLDPRNPSYNLLRTPNFYSLFELNGRLTPPIGIRLRPHFLRANIKASAITKLTSPSTPTWIIPTPSAFLQLSAFPKSQYNPLFFLNKFYQLTRHFHDYSFIYTDGSTRNDSSAAVCPGLNLSTRLPEGASIFSAEARAIVLALNYIELSFHPRFVIFSDSFSVLTAIRNLNWSNPLILQILLKYHSLREAGKKIILFWIPSHVGIPGNEKADIAAKKALQNPISDMTIPFSDFRHNISNYIKNCWQNAWNTEIHNKLHSINPKIGLGVPIHSLSRREDVVMTRLRLGHTLLTHTHLLSNSPNPICPTCGSDLTINHILLTCPDLDIHRNSLSSLDSIYSFKTTHLLLFLTIYVIAIFS